LHIFPSLVRRGWREAPGWFYERGCQDKYSPASRRQGIGLATSPLFRRDDSLSGGQILPPFVMASDGPQKLKSVWRLRGLPTIVLSESQWTIAFPGRARGDRVCMGLGPKSWTNHPEDPHPRPYPFGIHRRRSGCDLSSCRQTIPNGYVVQFSFFGSNVSPFFQILSAMAAILRASVSRAISLRMPLSCKPCR
jgi:hypothetical protein